MLSPQVSGRLVGVAAVFWDCPPRRLPSPELVHHCLVLPPGTHGFAGGRHLENQCPPASMRSSELATFHAPQTHAPNQHKNPRNPGVYYLLTFIPSFQPHSFDPCLPDCGSCTRIRRQFGIDLVDFYWGENVGQLGHVLDDFAHNHASVHDFDAARPDVHFLQRALIAENDIRFERISLERQLTFQRRDAALILPNRVVKLLLRTPFHRLGPITTVFVAENAAAEILRLEHIDTGPCNHHEINIDRGPIALRQMKMRQQPIRLAQFFQVTVNHELATRPLVQQRPGKTAPARGTVARLDVADVNHPCRDKKNENDKK